MGEIKHMTIQAKDVKPGDWITINGRSKIVWKVIHDEELTYLVLSNPSFAYLNSDILDIKRPETNQP